MEQDLETILTIMFTVGSIGGSTDPLTFAIYRSR